MLQATLAALARGGSAPIAHTLRTDNLKQRPDPVDRLCGPARQDVELALGGDIGPAEHGRRDIGHTGRGVGCDQLVRKGDRDRRGDDMDNAMCRFVEQSGRDDHILDRGVVGEHGKHRFGVERHFRISDRGDTFDRDAGAVPGHHLMARIDQVACHRGAHRTKPDKSYAHIIPPYSDAAAGPRFASRSRR